jgi:hypothetical protein
MAPLPLESKPQDQNLELHPWYPSFPQRMYTRSAGVTRSRAGPLQPDSGARPASLGSVKAALLPRWSAAVRVAWPKLVAQVAAAYRALPAGQRSSTAILTGNYGEAGAIDRYGPQHGLPQAYCGSNSFWFLGPPPAAESAAIVVNVDPAVTARSAGGRGQADAGHRDRR